ncbi:MAG TPA: DNA primase DnaG [Candidatus Bathyarchaeia archaeon]|nr:DNA primase DnaG [Candidatus Bathyarchaeia archaeon]
MGTNSQYSTTKYMVVARFEVEGVVEKPDVIGAIFGQTEGLFGPELDLRELQKSGRIGRIEIQLDSKQDKTFGTITIPSSLDKSSTAIIAAAIQSVDRIGPCLAKVILEKVADIREDKRRQILDKAKDILRTWVVEESPSTDEMVKQVSGVIRSSDVVAYGPDRLPAGPDVANSPSVILVEGRADIILLLRCGIRNALAIEGTKIPQTIIDICKTKETTAFLDGDRGGDLILKELMQVAPVDFLTRAPLGKEVEELTPKEIMKCLREKVPVENGKQISQRPQPIEAPYSPPIPRPPPPVQVQLPQNLVAKARELRGMLEGVLLDQNMSEVARLPVSELASKLALPKDNGGYQGVETIVFDGVVTQRVVDLAEEHGVKLIVGDRIADLSRLPNSVRIMTIPEVAGAP